MFYSILDLKVRNPYINLAIEESIADLLIENNELNSALRIWFSKKAIILGRTCDYKLNIANYKNYFKEADNLKAENQILSSSPTHQSSPTPTLPLASPSTPQFSPTPPFQPKKTALDTTSPTPTLSTTSSPTPQFSPKKTALHSSSPPTPTLPVLRRLSGGGTVVLSPFILNYTIYINIKKFPELFNINNSYNVLLGFVINSLNKQFQNTQTQILGQSDLVMVDNNKKFSGNAQYRRRNILVLHGTLILNEKAIILINDYLSHPPKEPNYRKNRTHLTFLTALPEYFQINIFYQNLKNEILNYCKLKIENEVNINQKLKSLNSIIKSKVQNFYKNNDWITLGKNPNTY